MTARAAVKSPSVHTPAGLLFDGSKIWVAHFGDNTVSKIEPKTGVIELTANVGDSPIDVAFDGVHVWATNSGSDDVMKLRRGTGTVQKVYPMGDYPVGVAFDGTSIWIANAEKRHGNQDQPLGVCFRAILSLARKFAALTTITSFAQERAMLFARHGEFVRWRTCKRTSRGREKAEEGELK